MKYNQFGVPYTSEKDLAQQIYANPDLDLSQIALEDPEQYNTSVAAFNLDWAEIGKYDSASYERLSLDEFDLLNQNTWLMPQEYHDMDIAQWVLDQCDTDAELQRAGEELLLFQERNVFDLLRYLKYLVNTMRKNNIVWGVGRGSSVASFVLYKIGVHRINSLYYDLDPREFLK
jgi:Bacterial DNA polymerase III alpha NTPase domain